MKVQHGDEIEVVDERGPQYGRIRVRERSGKASAFLTADELEQHGQQCLDLAAALRQRADPGPRPDQVIVAFCNKCDRWTMQCTQTTQNRRVWIKIAEEAGDRIAYVDSDELADVLGERGSCDGTCEAKAVR